MNWEHPNPFTRKVTVQASDIDGLGHANNACYVRWCESCAWQHSQALGLSVEDYQDMDRGVAIHKANYEYYLPTFTGDSLVVGTWLTECDRRLRLRRKFQIINIQSGAIVLSGCWDLISVALSTGKAVRMPRRFAEVYGGAVIDISES